MHFRTMKLLLPLSLLACCHAFSPSLFHPPPLSQTRISRSPLFAKDRGAQEVTDGSSKLRQLAGVKGGRDMSTSDDIWAIRLQLTKPISKLPFMRFKRLNKRL